MFVAFVGLAAVEGCGSDSNHATKKLDAGLGTAGAATGLGAGGGPSSSLTGSSGAGAGTCASNNGAFCPMMPGATQCCVDANTCGYNAGNGCVPFAGKPDAGAH